MKLKCMMCEDATSASCDGRAHRRIFVKYDAAGLGHALDPNRDNDLFCHVRDPCLCPGLFCGKDYAADCMRAPVSQVGDSVDASLLLHCYSDSGCDCFYSDFCCDCKDFDFCHRVAELDSDFPQTVICCCHHCCHRCYYQNSPQLLHCAGHCRVMPKRSELGSVSGKAPYCARHF